VATSPAGLRASRGLPLFRSVVAAASERDETRPGDDLVERADVTMDRAFTVPGAPETVWPWIVQLGKKRAGWYFGRRVERFIPRRRRALRAIDPRWQALEVGDHIPDYGGPNETFTVAEIAPPHRLVYVSQRGAAMVSWSIMLRQATDDGDAGAAHTRVLLRLRIGPVRRVWLAETVGGLIDLLTIAGLASGLRERLAPVP
jgi:hypothetical protein